MNGGGIVIDSSAFLAMLLREPERDSITEAVLKAERRWISAFSMLEASIVFISRKGAIAYTDFDNLCDELGLMIVPLSVEQAFFARAAWEHFGKGQHPAALNIGDCCSYALAKSEGLPLLCKGDDFRKTDLVLVQY